MSLQFNESTSKILKNFSAVNDQILFRPGNTVLTLSVGKRIIAKAKIDTSFDRVFGIDQLSKLLNTVGLFKEPKIVLGEKALMIKDNNKVVSYTYTEPESILSVTPDKVEDLEKGLTPSYEFQMGVDVLHDITKAKGIMNLPDLGFVGNGEVAVIQLFNRKDPTSHIYKLKIGETSQTFRLIMDAEYLNKLFPSNYNVRLDFKKKFANFESVESGIQYFMAMEFDDDES